MKPVLFLDIDGVLNHDGEGRKTYSFSLPEIENERCDVQFSSKNIGLYNNLIDEIGENNIDIVISSTWRIEFPIQEMTGIFRHMNIKGNIIGYTPDLFYDIYSHGRRGDEIDRYIKDNLIIDFIVIDDDDQMVHEYIKDRWVQTYDNEGFNEECLGKAIEIYSRSKT